jgi:hypothetical protein
MVGNFMMSSSDPGSVKRANDRAVPINEKWVEE